MFHGRKNSYSFLLMIIIIAITLSCSVGRRASSKNSGNSSIITRLSEPHMTEWSSPIEPASYSEKELVNNDGVKDSNMIVLKADWTGLPWLSLCSGEQIELPDYDHGPYIILNMATWDPYGATLLTTYYSHSILGCEEIGYWYTVKDTIVLEPRGGLFEDSVFVMSQRPDIFVKKLLVDGDEVRDVTVYPENYEMMLNGRIVDDSGVNGISKYVVIKNAELLKRILKAEKSSIYGEAIIQLPKY